MGCSDAEETAACFSDGYSFVFFVSLSRINLYFFCSCDGCRPLFVNSQGSQVIYLPKHTLSKEDLILFACRYALSMTWNTNAMTRLSSISSQFIYMFMCLYVRLFLIVHVNTQIGGWVSRREERRGKIFGLCHGLRLFWRLRDDSWMHVRWALKTTNITNIKQENKQTNQK